MNKIKLPSMVGYVKLTEHKRLKTFITETKVLGYDKNLKFSNFISQEPNIGMVVRAVFENGEWRILEKPRMRWKNSKDRWGTSIETDEWIEYTTALDNVIFEGFEYDGSEEGFIYVKNGETLLIFDTENKTLFLYNSKNNYMTEIKTIEDLIPYSLTLTPKFAKELGL
jgi:hypothetical protein